MTDLSQIDLVPRTFAFSAAMQATIPSLALLHGALAMDVARGRGEFPCLFVRWDDTEHTRVRATGLMNETPVRLKDGRLAVVGALWSRALLAAVARGDVVAEELSADELAALVVQPG